MTEENNIGASAYTNCVFKEILSILGIHSKVKKLKFKNIINLLKNPLLLSGNNLNRISVMSAISSTQKNFPLYLVSFILPRGYDGNPHKTKT